jgi:hypothetical protein
VIVNSSLTLVLFFERSDSAVEARHSIVSGVGLLPLNLLNLILLSCPMGTLQTSALVIEISSSSRDNTSSSESNMSYLSSICIFFTADKNPMFISSLSCFLSAFLLDLTLEPALAALYLWAFLQGMGFSKLFTEMESLDDKESSTLIVQRFATLALDSLSCLRLSAAAYRPRTLFFPALHARVLTSLRKVRRKKGRFFLLASFCL